MTPRRSVPAIVIGCALVVMTGRDVEAQGVATPAPIQLAGSAGVVFFLPTFGVRLSVPVSPRFSLEGAGEYVPLTFEDDGSVWYLFQAQLRHRLNRGRIWQIHATYGATVFGKSIHRREVRESRPDGSVIVYPEYRRMDLASPAGVHAGLGAERSLSHRVAVRWDVQVIVPLGQDSVPAPRAVFGIAWQRGRRQ